MATINCTFDEFKEQAGIFFRSLPDSNQSEVDNGMKCLSLMYIGLSCNDLERYESELVMRVATRKSIEREIELT